MKARMPGGPRYTITSLAVMVKATARGLWPTPSASEGKYRLRASGDSQQFSRSLSSIMRRRALIDGANSGQLSPTWVEWLMGFPLGWTDCGDLGTPSSRK
jgi:hypothetical protein